MHYLLVLSYCTFYTHSFSRLIFFWYMNRVLFLPTKLALWIFPLKMLSLMQSTMKFLVLLRCEEEEKVMRRERERECVCVCVCERGRKRK